VFKRIFYYPDNALKGIEKVRVDTFCEGKVRV